MFLRRTISEMSAFQGFEFDFKNVPYVESPWFNSMYSMFYLFEGHNCDLAVRDIMLINELWVMAVSLCNELPFFQIKLSDLSFIPQRDEYGNYMWKSFSYFCCKPYTPTGRIRTLPFIIEFFAGNPLEDNFLEGKISYSPDGFIKKFEAVYCPVKRITLYDRPQIEYRLKFIYEGVMRVSHISIISQLGGNELYCDPYLE